MAAHLHRVAVVGNPNAGKTTLFNALTGLHQKVANYAGVTVERVTGSLKRHPEIQLSDVPGLYSLKAISEDEQVAVHEITTQGEDSPDLLVVVIDATNLERNLYLYTQIAELGRPTIVALTMVDRVGGLEAIDAARLSNLLGCEVVPIDGRRDRGIEELVFAIERNLAEPRLPTIDLLSDPNFEGRLATLRERFARMGTDVTRADLIAEIDAPSDRYSGITMETPELAEEITSLRADRPHGTATATIEDRYRWSAMISRAVDLNQNPRARASLTDRIDTILTHRVFGLLIFIAIMYGVFQAIYTFAQPLMDLMDGAFGWLGEKVSPMLAGVPLLQSLVVDGIIAGVGGVLVFLPQILILFGLIAMLEGTGYLARAAFLMDRLLGWCGLNGRAFIPLLSSFACAIPGIMAARVMPDARSRLTTILVAPLMSCSARLPVYIVLIGAVIKPRFGPQWAGFTLFAMHFLGLLLAVPIAYILNRKVVKGKRLPFMLELPPYQWPRMRDVVRAMWFRGKLFVTTAGTTILIMSMIIWAAGTFPRPSAEMVASIPEGPQHDAILAERALENSALGRVGHTIEPVFAPAGFDWRISTSVLAAFPARELVVPSLGILFSLGSDTDEGSADLISAIQNAKRPDGTKLFNAWNSVGLMVFFALCAQCLATLATVRRETNSRFWPVFMFTYMTVLAYLFAVGIYQLGRLVGGIP